MKDNDPLLMKADALMKRHRSPVVDDTLQAQDDVPVLTEIVAVPENADVPPSVVDVASLIDEKLVDERVRERLALLLPALRHQVAKELDAWFDEQLPQLVTALLDGFTDRLVGQICAQARGDLMTWLQTVGEDLDALERPD